MYVFIYRGLDGAKYENAWNTLRSVQGVLIPGGFGVRGVHGHIHTYIHTYIHAHMHMLTDLPVATNREDISCSIR